MFQTLHQSNQPPKANQSTKITPATSLSSQSSNDSSNDDDHIRDTLDSAEKWITQQLLFHEYVTAYDLLEHFDVDSNLARMLITRFEKRTSTYDIYPLSMDSTIPRSSLQPLEQMLASNIDNNTDNNAMAYNTLDINFDFDDREELTIDTDSIDDINNSRQKPHNGSNCTKLFLAPTSSNDVHGDLISISRSVSPRMYTNPLDYIDYNKSNFDTWFSSEKHKYIMAIQECAASYNIGLPEFIAEIIIINTVLLPGCYTLTGLLFPAARNELDLFAEYANKENGYITSKADKGIAYKRKKPMLNVRRPENNTASLWLDEDGSICGFRCIWVHGIRGKLMVDQKYCVLNGCWTLSGEITISFEQWDVEDEFEGYLETETFCGRWTAGNELYGEFQWFITTIESFYLNHNIPYDNIGSIGGDTVKSTRLGFHDSMGVSMEDEFDLDELMSPISHGTNGGNNPIETIHMPFSQDPINILYNKIFDIEINESLTITAKFCKQNNDLEISEKSDINDIGNIVTGSDSFLDSEDDNEIIGYGKWFRNGKMSFKNVKYIDQKLLLSFDGCCDGKKVLGRLCIYHDNTSDSLNDKQLGRQKKSKSISNQNKYDDEINDKIDIDDDDDQLFSGNVFDDDETDEDEDDDDDDERISFIQMIIVSNIVPA